MTSRPNPIQAVLFDYGMVLSAGPDPAAWQHMLQITGFSEETLQKGYWAFRHDYDRGDLNGLEYWARVAESGQTTFTSEQIGHLVEADIALWTRLNSLARLGTTASTRRHSHRNPLQHRGCHDRGPVEEVRVDLRL